MQDPEFEALWAWIRPKKLPRGIPCAIVATIYHPYLNDSARGVALLDYLSGTLATGEGEFPGYGILLGEDLNRLKANRLSTRLENVNWSINLPWVIKFWTWF